MHNLLEILIFTLRNFTKLHILRYLGICNVLHIWYIRAIPTYRVYRLYDNYYAQHDNNIIIKQLYINLRAAPSSTQSEPSEAPYLLLANRRYIHQISLDGSRLRTIISEPSQHIYTLDYHSR